MIQIHSSEQAVVTPEMAKGWLRDNLFPRYRNISPSHRNDLVREIKGGRFIPGTQIHFARFHGEQFLVNGRHVLAAIEQADTPVTLSILVSDTDSMDEVAGLYCRHDANPRRTNNV